MKNKKLVLFGVIFLVIILFKLTLISAACISGGSGWNRGCVSATKIHGVIGTGAYWEENCCSGLYCCQGGANNQWGCYSTAVSCACTTAGLIWYNGACCTLSTWTPDPSTICSGTSFTQTSNCGTTRAATGTKQPNCPAASTVQCGQSITSTNGCGTCSGTGTQCQSDYNCQNGNCVIGSPPPKGSFDNAGCDTNDIWGWTCDENDYNQAIDIHFYVDGEAGAGGTMIGATTANKVRTDVGPECGGNSTHGFEWTIPDSLKNGQQHTIYAYGIDYPSQNNNPKLDGSPKIINCVGAVAPPTCVTINGIQHCCGNQIDNICPEDFENATGYRLNCDALNLHDTDCDVATTQCTINSATITPHCGAGGCVSENNITISVSYGGTNCQVPPNSYIQVDANSTDNSCYLSYSNIYGGNGFMHGMEVTCNSGTCVGNWTIPSTINSQCLGDNVYAWAVGLYNDSNYQNHVAGKINTISPGFGSFTFAGQPNKYTVIVSLVNQTSNSLMPGVNATFDGNNQGTGNPKTINNIPEGTHIFSGTSKATYTVNPVTLNVNQNMGVSVLYNSTPLNSFKFDITAKNGTTNQNIGNIQLWIKTGGNYLNVANAVGNLVYDYPAGYPMEYKITFSEILGYNSPEMLEGNTNSNGFLTATVYYTLLDVNDLSNIIIIPPAVSLEPGKSVDYQIFANYSDNSLRNVTADASLTSSNPSACPVIGKKVTVSATASAGTTCIMTASYSGKSSTSIITILPSGSNHLSYIIIEPSGSVVKNVSESQTYSARAFFSNGTYFVVTTNAKFNSSNSFVATNSVNNNIFNANNPGIAEIMANYTYGPTTKYSQAAVFIVKEPPINQWQFKSNYLEGPAGMINETYDYYKHFAIFNWTINNILFIMDVTDDSTFASNNTGKAVFDANIKNKIHAIGVGNVNITSNYSWNSQIKPASKILTIGPSGTPLPRNLILIPESSTINRAKTQNYTVKINKTDNTQTTLIPLQYVLTSSNVGVAEIDSVNPDTAKGISVGSVIIKATATPSGIYLEDYSTLNVVEGVISECTCGITPANQCIDDTHRCHRDATNICSPVLDSTCGVVTFNRCHPLTQITCYGTPNVNPSCYWNNSFCKSCIGSTTVAPTYQAVSICGDYNNANACDTDSCNIGIAGCQTGDTCECLWNNTISACARIETDIITGETCTSTVVDETDCGEGGASCSGNKRLITFSTVPEGCTSGSTCLACAGFRLLPGFDYINLILVLALLVGYYGYSTIKKK